MHGQPTDVIELLRAQVEQLQAELDKTKIDLLHRVDFMERVSEHALIEVALTQRCRHWQRTRRCRDS